MSATASSSDEKGTVAATQAKKGWFSKKDKQQTKDVDSEKAADDGSTDAKTDGKPVEEDVPPVSLASMFR